MIIKRDEYVVYNTSESNGLDICIKDNIDRYTLIPVDCIPDLVADLQEILLERSETESAERSYDALWESW